MIREVLRMGDPRLLLRAQPVAAFGTPELAALIEDMQDTMRHLDGAGLAAPQIGVSLRVVIFGFESNPRYPDAAAVPFTVLINP
ncbi:MAG TPA: peptide deformylase, partial [Rhodocyclaceae bacterium]|nr:peptide deformylase [Rhodocyclaceae bacterium]